MYLIHFSLRCSLLDTRLRFGLYITSTLAIVVTKRHESTNAHKRVNGGKNTRAALMFFRGFLCYSSANTNQDLFNQTETMHQLPSCLNFHEMIGDGFQSSRYEEVACVSEFLGKFQPRNCVVSKAAETMPGKSAAANGLMPDTSTQTGQKSSQPNRVHKRIPSQTTIDKQRVFILQPSLGTNSGETSAVTDEPIDP